MATEFRAKNNILANVDGQAALAVTDIGANSVVQNAAALTAFGEASVAQNQCQVGWGPFQVLASQLVVPITSGSGSVDVDGNFARAQTGTDTTGAAALRSVAYFSYNPGIGAIIRFTTVFDTPQEDSDQIQGVFTFDPVTFQPANGWGIGYKGLEFGIFRFSKGVEQEFIPQSSWSEDTKSSLIPQNGNVYQFKLQWLGFGMQFFDIEGDDGTGTFQNAHNIDYANKNTETSVEFPSVPITMLVRNRGNASNLTIKSPSAYAASQGEAFPTAFTTLNGIKLPIGSVSTGENYGFSIQNPLTFNSLENYRYIEPVLLSLVSDDLAPVTFDIYFNMTLTGANFTDVSPTSTPALVDFDATAWSGGEFVTTISISRDSQVELDVASLFEARIWPGATLTLIIDAASNANAGAGLTFRSRI